MASYLKSWWNKDDDDPSRNQGRGKPKGQQSSRRNKNQRPTASSSRRQRSRSPSPMTEQEDLNLETGKVINCLLLGETGVGKSTFINSLANYLEFHENFENAETESLQVIIPTSITTYDRHGKMKILEVGQNHKNENTSEVGASATQKIRTYKFTFASGGFLNLIDTPGMGDTRGIKQDEENCDYILDYISNLNELHAICYLFRPEVSRATAHFRYCVTQILSRLEKSACNNIAFVFTDAKNFNPGETLSILQNLAANIKKQPPYVSIPVENNLFCFDNEPFKYLAAVQRGVEYAEDYRRAMKRTWKKSTEECYRLIEYIIKLTPHNVRNTTAINECRRVIFQLSKPMADIAQNIDDNLYMLERHEAEMNLEKSTLEELKDKLYIPIVDLEVKELDKPATVCTDSKCAEVVMVGKRTKFHYKTRCHDPCHLTQVPKDVIGDPALISCYAMSGSGQTCAECGCHYKVHMHVYYDSETVNKKEVDKNIKANMKSREEILETAKKNIERTKKKKAELQAELDVIVNYNAKFAHFVQNNAITPINDSYEEYIKHLITAENRLGANSDSRKLDGLRQLLKEHGQVKVILEKADQHNKKMGNALQSVTSNDIQNGIQQIFKLKHNGDKIKKMYEAQNKSRNSEYLDSEYLHTTTFGGKKRQDKNNKQKDKGKNGKKSSGSHQTPSYSQATKGYPEVPIHEIDSDDDDDDSNEDESGEDSPHESHHSAHNETENSRPERRRAPEPFPEPYARGPFNRETWEYPDEYARMVYFFNRFCSGPRRPDDFYYRDVYPERFYAPGMRRDVPDMWTYRPHEPHYFSQERDMPPRYEPSARDTFRHPEGPFRPDHRPSYREDFIQQTSGGRYGPPPAGFSTDYPERAHFRDFPQRNSSTETGLDQSARDQPYNVRYPVEKNAENGNYPAKEYRPPHPPFYREEFDPPRHRDSLGPQEFGPQRPRDSIAPEEFGSQRPMDSFRRPHEFGSQHPRDSRGPQEFGSQRDRDSFGLLQESKGPRKLFGPQEFGSHDSTQSFSRPQEYVPQRPRDSLGPQEFDRQRPIDSFSRPQEFGPQRHKDLLDPQEFVPQRPRDSQVPPECSSQRPKDSSDRQQEFGPQRHRDSHGSQEFGSQRSIFDRQREFDSHRPRESQRPREFGSERTIDSCGRQKEFESQRPKDLHGPQEFGSQRPIDSFKRQLEFDPQRPRDSHGPQELNSQRPVDSFPRPMEIDGTHPRDSAPVAPFYEDDMGVKSYSERYPSRYSPPPAYDVCSQQNNNFVQPEQENITLSSENNSTKNAISSIPKNDNATTTAPQYANAEVKNDAKNVKKTKQNATAPAPSTTPKGKK